MRFFLYILLSITLFASQLVAQIDGIPDTICAEEIITPTYNGTEADSYLWNFNTGKRNNTLFQKKLPENQLLTEPAFMAIAKDNGKYYGFVTNNYPKHNKSSIIRYSFGDSLLNNNPVVDSLLLNNLPDHLEGIQVKKDVSGNWYGFAVGIKESNDMLIRLDFGADLSSTPSITQIKNVDALMDWPTDFNLIYEAQSSSWIGLVTNRKELGDNGFLTRIIWTNGLNNTPTIDTIQDIQLNQPSGIFSINQDNIWYVFVANLGSSSTTKLTFGKSLTIRPTSYKPQSKSTLMSPSDLIIINDCNTAFGIIISRFRRNVYQINFSNSLSSNFDFVDLGPNYELIDPHGISDVFREDNKTFFFVTNADHTISRLYYENDASSTSEPPLPIPSTIRNPEPFTYTTAGTYNISLIIDNGLPTERIFCKDIVVNPKPVLELLDFDPKCPQSGSSIIEPKTDGFYKYEWFNGSTDSVITVNPIYGLNNYWLKVTNQQGCSDIDTTKIIVESDNKLSVGRDTSFTLGESITLGNIDGTILSNYTWTSDDGFNETADNIEVTKPGTYFVRAFYDDCTYLDTIAISLKIEVLNFFTPNNDGVNETWLPKVFVHYPEAEITIFDRYGKALVRYLNTAFPNGWDGTYNGTPLEADTYWYVIDLKNNIKPITGQVTIKR